MGVPLSCPANQKTLQLASHQSLELYGDVAIKLSSTAIDRVYLSKDYSELRPQLPPESLPRVLARGAMSHSGLLAVFADWRVVTCADHFTFEAGNLSLGRAIELQMMVPNEYVFWSLFGSMHAMGAALEANYEYIQNVSLDSVFLMGDNSVKTTHPYVDERYVQTVAKVTKVSY
jgi:hypothetical protein